VHEEDNAAKANEISSLRDQLRRLNRTLQDSAAERLKETKVCDEYEYEYVMFDV